MKEHFCQADGTPLTSPEWNRRLVQDEFVEHIRDNDFSMLENESVAIQEYSRAMSTCVSEIEMPKFEYSLEDWSEHIRRVKERTATSPDGRHYGHLKVILEKAPDIFQYIYLVMKTAMDNGVLLQR